jgi:4-amino-4-deoxy-L-arabinose transferase-like glycosyltransferase
LRAWPAKSDAWWACGLAALLVLWHLPGFTLTPGVNHDEIILNAAARNWTAHGLIALTPLAGQGETYATAYYWHPPGHLWLMAAAYRLLGFSIEVTRGVSLAGGAVAVMLVFLLLRRLAVERPVAAAATVLFIGNPAIWWLCRSGRMDMSAISFGLAALLVLGGDREHSSPARAALAGLLVGIGSLFHVMVLAWAPALVAAEATRGDRMPWRNALLISGLAALPVTAWIAVTFARGDGPAWVEQFVGYQLGQRTAAIPLWRRLPEELLLFPMQFRHVPALLLLVGLGVGHGWSRTQRARRWAAGGAIAAFGLIAVATAKGSSVYPLYWFLWLIPVAAPGLALLRPKIRTGLFALAIANVASVQLGTAAVALYQREARDPARVDRFFAAHLKPGTLVLGPEDAWYAIEHAGARLRIWEQPDPRRHDYCVTFANIPAEAPPGFELLAELPDTMPKFLGHYWSHTSCSYRIWVPKR